MKSLFLQRYKFITDQDLNQKEQLCQVTRLSLWQTYYLNWTHKKTKEVPRVIYGNIFLKHLNLSISFCTVPTTIWPIFSKFLIFCRLTLWAFRWVNQQQNMSKEENIGHIVQDKRAITSLLRMCKISTTCQAIYQI